MSYWSIVNKVIRDSDMLLLILDARMVEETRNEEVEAKVERSGKKLMYVINKTDLVGKEKVEKYKSKLTPLVFVSSKEFHGTKKLRDMIKIEAKRHNLKEVKVGVLGYPNVGKSSVINALKGKSSAPTSIKSGFTKALQEVRVDTKIKLIDTPGVLPRGKTDKTITLDFNKAQDLDLEVFKIIQENPGVLEAHYDVKENDDFVEELALKLNMIKKGKEPDIDRAAKKVLYDWQKGNIKTY